MERSEIYKLVIMAGLHLRLKAKISPSTKSVKIDQVKMIVTRMMNELERHGFFEGILNKSRLAGESIKHYFGVMKKGIDDEVMSTSVLEKLTGEKREGKEYYFFALCCLAYENDHRISTNERDILKFHYERLGISKKPFHKYLTMTLKKYFKDAKEIEPPAVWKTKFKVLALPSVLLIIVIGALSFLGIQLHGKSKAPIGRQISNISYKKISFERYITAGNFKSGDRSDQTGKLVVFYVKGTADVEFDLKNLELSREPQGVMAVYRNTKASQIGFLETKPFIIDVNIAQKDIFQVFHIDPQALRESQARFPAAAFGTVAALGGAYVGGQLGTAVGSAMPHPIFKLAAGPGGAILGGTAGGMGGYILAKNLLTKVQITDAISQGDKEEILSKTKALIAAELLFDEKLSEEMKKEFEAYVKNFYRQFAIEISDIKYSIQTTTQKS